MRNIYTFLILLVTFVSCKKKESDDPIPEKYFEMRGYNLTTKKNSDWLYTLIDGHCGFNIYKDYFALEVDLNEGKPKLDIKVDDYYPVLGNGGGYVAFKFKARYTDDLNIGEYSYINIADTENDFFFYNTIVLYRNPFGGGKFYVKTPEDYVKFKITNKYTRRHSAKKRIYVDGEYEIYATRIINNYIGEPFKLLGSFKGMPVYDAR